MGGSGEGSPRRNLDTPIYENLMETTFVRFLVEHVGKLDQINIVFNIEGDV